ncbi:hypothetical protein LTR56_005895 [Elasticomyces elasticus]|nr:hypothetical protein LTR56_005895 [Elasticomyces elasticus]KAK5752160.1 hypothetical protein LTS12_017755 [Elasticomyces elasticus]
MRMLRQACDNELRAMQVHNLLQYQMPKERLLTSRRAVHKSVCNSTLAEELNEDLRPSPEHRRAIFMSETGERPKFVWVYDASSSTGAGDAIGVTMCFELIPIVQGGKGEGKHLDHDINVNVKDDMQIDGVSQTNTVMNSLTKGITSEYWKGPLVVCGTLKDEMIDNLSYLENHHIDLYPCDIGLSVKVLARMAKARKTGGYRIDYFKE